MTDAPQKATIAVMSDLHCHLAVDVNVESFLTVGALRIPSNHHPIEALIDLINKLRLRADALLVPGDLCNKMSKEGFQHAWELTAEVSRALGNVPVLPVVGNHDVDSRKLLTKDPFMVARRLRRDFPFGVESMNNDFFASGCCVFPVSEALQVVVLNSVIDHHDEASAKRGTFNEERIAKLEKKLEGLPAPGSIVVALMHHHPVLHSSPIISSLDVLEYGDQILDALRQRGCLMVVHGHKHHPRLRYANTSYGEIVVFAAGSFSAFLEKAGTFTRNAFHIMDIHSSDSIARPIKGQIQTWEWRLGTGWIPASEQSCDFPFLAGFGSEDSVESTLVSLSSVAAANRSIYLFDQDIVARAVPELHHMTPDEIGVIQRSLESCYRLVLGRSSNGRFELQRIYDGGTVPRA